MGARNWWIKTRFVYLFWWKPSQTPSPPPAADLPIPPHPWSLLTLLFASFTHTLAALFSRRSLWFWMRWFPILLSLPSQSATLFISITTSEEWEAERQLWMGGGLSVAAPLCSLKRDAPVLSVNKWLVATDSAQANAALCWLANCGSSRSTVAPSPGGDWPAIAGWAVNTGISLHKQQIFRLHRLK